MIVYVYRHRPLTDEERAELRRGLADVAPYLTPVSASELVAVERRQPVRRSRRERKALRKEARDR